MVFRKEGRREQESEEKRVQGSGKDRGRKNRPQITPRYPEAMRGTAQMDTAR
jgi:hypothetical protein